MSVLREIFKWSQSLEEWKSDAIRRLFIKGKLDDEDIDDIYALLKVEHGIPDKENRKSIKLSENLIPAQSSNDTTLRLIALKDFNNVNRIAKSQTLTFGQYGLTTIYGENGSGKSGYSRVLKRACRARDQEEPIHPDIFSSSGQSSKATAIFEVIINDKKEEICLTDGQPSPNILSSIAVFDSRCARNYLDKEGDFSYIPYGLDILEELAIIYNKVKVKLEMEQRLCAVDNTQFSYLEGNTAVGLLIKGLSSKTTATQVEKLATLSDQELKTHKELECSLNESNPKEKIKFLKLFSSRISKISQKCDDALALINDEVANKFINMLESLKAAKTAVAIAAEEFNSSGSCLTGTGSEAWKNLFEAARKFSYEAYPDKIFPELGPDAKCLLCQQPLGNNIDRFVLFNNFVLNETEENLKSTQENLDQAISDFNKHVEFVVDEEFILELSSYDENLAIKLKTFEKALNSRYQAIREALNTTLGLNALPIIENNPSIELRTLVSSINDEIQLLTKLQDQDERILLESEFNELNDRVRLSSIKTNLLSHLDKLYICDKLAKCARSISTRQISIKVSELHEQVVSKQLEDAINNEFKLLGVDTLKVRLKSRIEKAKSLHKLVFDMPHTKSPSEILSEGEQRAIAIASFLAEISINNNSNGIIFDDPVSSLDHKRRERVARRLVQEASKRQVIVFTHDIYFLNLLEGESDKARTTFIKMSLHRCQSGFGVVNPNLPFEGMNTKDRVKCLRDRLPYLRQLFDSGEELTYNKQVSDFYRELRITWERAVEEVLFNGTIVRYRKSIETQRLKEVKVEDTDYDTIHLRMAKCSNFAHDQAQLGTTSFPSPEEACYDIDVLEKWAGDTKKRNSITGTDRKFKNL